MAGTKGSERHNEPRDDNLKKRKEAAVFLVSEHPKRLRVEPDDILTSIRRIRQRDGKAGWKKIAEEVRLLHGYDIDPTKVKSLMKQHSLMVEVPPRKFSHLQSEVVQALPTHALPRSNPQDSESLTDSASEMENQHDKRLLKAAIQKLKVVDSSYGVKRVWSSLRRSGWPSLKLSKVKNVMKSMELLVKPTTPSGPKRFECHLCDKSYTRKHGLTRHLRVHTGETPFKCAVCDKSFSLKSTLNEHARVHNGDMPFSCSICSRAFRAKSTWQRHLKTHSREKNFKCPFDGCEKAFSRKFSLTQHIRSQQHTGSGSHLCSICNKILSSSSKLQSHLMTHGDGRESYCRYGLSSNVHVSAASSDLLTSFALSPTATRPNRSYTTRDIVGDESDNLSHSDSRTSNTLLGEDDIPSNCKTIADCSTSRGCSERTSDREEAKDSDYAENEIVQGYTRVVGGRDCTSQLWVQNMPLGADSTAAATVDDESCNEYSNRRHQIHCRLRNFKCTFTGCSKSFAYKHVLEQHLRTHTAERPFVCTTEQCGKAFKSLAALAKHRSRDTQVHRTTASNLRYMICGGARSSMNYHCEKCAMRFPGKFEQDRHTSRCEGRSGDAIESVKSCGGHEFLENPAQKQNDGYFETYSATPSDSAEICRSSDATEKDVMCPNSISKGCSSKVCACRTPTQRAATRTWTSLRT